MPRKPVKSPARSEAMLGNKNAEKSPEEHTPEPLRTSMALRHEIKERLRQAMIAHNGGGYPSDEKVKEFFRELAYGAVNDFIGRMERDHEGTMIV